MGRGGGKLRNFPVVGLRVFRGRAEESFEKSLLFNLLRRCLQTRESILFRVGIVSRLVLLFSSRLFREQESFVDILRIHFANKNSCALYRLILKQYPPIASSYRCIVFISFIFSESYRIPSTTYTYLYILHLQIGFREKSK